MIKLGFSLLFILPFFTINTNAQILENLDLSIEQQYDQVLEWRRHCHQFPELSNREFNTSDYIVAQLKKMEIRHEQGMAKTGVIGIIDSGNPGPVIALRADIDGLPVTERGTLPFASKEKTTFLGKETGIMHACGHDTHIAMLLGAAQILKNHQSTLTGKVILVFQPAEEGPPPGEEGGAKLMIKEGLIAKYGIDVFFGQHIRAGLDIGHISYKIGGMMAAVDRFVIKVKGKQTHGSRPWGGVDPIVAGAQILMGLQTIISRQTDLTREAAVITVGKINGGVRYNIIPEEMEMIGTIRTLNEEMREKIHADITRTATTIAHSQGATAEVEFESNCPVMINHLALTRNMVPSLFKVAGEENVHNIPAITGGEDFAFFANEVPSFYFFTGGKSPDSDEYPPHHTPDFYINEKGMKTGIKALVQLTIDYQKMKQ